MVNKQQQLEPRTFVKKVGEDTLTRQVTSPQAQVLAEFDGYREQAAPKTTRAAAAAAGS